MPGSGLVWCPPGVRRYIPLLASPQGGVAASSKKFREATEADAAGVVFLFWIHRKTTPASLEAARWRACASRRSEDAARHFIDRSATPPCGDARRGMAAPKHSDIFSLVRTRPLPDVQSFTGHPAFDTAVTWTASLTSLGTPAEARDRRTRL